MAVIHLTTEIHSPIERCFDLSRSIDFHAASLSDTSERPVEGVTSGLIGHGESVTWEARHFGVMQRLTSKITAFEPPHYFRDSMVKGAFRRFDHDHRFEQHEDITVMTDVFDYNAPLGPLGTVAEVTFLTRYMRRLLETRNLHLQEALESGAWKKFLSNP